VVGRRGADEVAGGRVDDPLRLRGRAARVEEVEEVLGVHRLARAGLGGLVHAVDELVPPDVALRIEPDVAAGAAEDDGPLHGRRA
jgi:hypothetical protein